MNANKTVHAKRHDEVVHVVFCPDHAAHVPDDGSLVTIVKFARINEELADCAAILTNQERDYTVTVIRGGGRNLDAATLARAEKTLAKTLALSLSRGEARRVVAYQEDVESLNVG